MNTGIVSFAYTRALPPGAVAIAQIKADPSYASDLIDVSNVNTVGTLGIWRYSTDGSGPVDVLTDPAHWTALGLNVPITISSARTYILDSQFFELTNVTAADTTALFYRHTLDSNANSITITDDSGNVVVTPQSIQDGILYHSLDGDLYWIRYVDSFGIIQKELLKYDPVIGQTTGFPSATSYTLSGRELIVNDVTPYQIRFTAYSIFGLQVPYGNLPNVPWFPRVRFPLTALIPEWAAQSFNPVNPYLLASWVTGAVIDTHILQLQREDIYPDNNHWPDVIIFDKNYVLKYALEGTSPDVASRRGTSYPWKRGQIQDVDFRTGRVQIIPDLAPDDIVFGFYSYRERDVVFTAIDCNPFTNPAIRNCVIRCYSRTDSDPFRRLFCQAIDFNGQDVAGLTNDPSPVGGVWTNPSLTIIGDIFVGASISAKNLTYTDARVRGGGLIPSMQSIPQAVNFWDVGYLDGKPYPVGGTMVVYLPYSLLDTMTRDEVQARVNKTVPMGILCILRYYNSSFQELV